MGLVLLIGLGLARTINAAPSPAVELTAGSMTPYPAGAILMGTIHVDAPPVTVEAGTVITAQRALAVATEAAGHLADAAKPYSAQLAEVTKDDYGTDDGAGGILKLIDHELCWVVRFTGTEQPVYGGVSSDGTPMAARVTATATELNVLVDARSGAVLLMFSFQ
jgi:hypothetical protein